MQKLQTLSVLEDELGEVQKSGMSGESLYYSAHWEEIQEQAVQVAREQYLDVPTDVRAANYALDLIGIPSDGGSRPGRERKLDRLLALIINKKT